MTFAKLSNLVDDQFTVEHVGGYKYKRYDAETKRMETSDTYVAGYRKVYEVDTDKGRLDLGVGQIGSLLEAVFKNGSAELNGRTFAVKSNGKTGMDIRYFFNPTPNPSSTPSVRPAASQNLADMGRDELNRMLENF